MDFRVKIDDSYRRDVKFLKELLVPNAQGVLAKLGQVGKLVKTKSYSAINHFITVLFKFFLKPLLIVAVIPFGIIGSLIAFAAHGVPLSLFAIVGMIGLSGVVVNDSLIMVDFINQKESNEEKNEYIESIIKGSKERFSPVILTTTTTVARLIPTVYGFGGSVGILVPAVMALAYGILFATAVTLLLIPVMYLIQKDIENMYIITVNKLKRKVNR